jgi:4-amino-4-deoxy-L-arabinose transferase-like glycosyltransferase
MATRLAAVRERLAGLDLLPIVAAVALLALLARLALLTAEPAFGTPDTPLYQAIAERLLYGLDHPGAKPLDTVRTPGYPLFLAAAKVLPGGWDDTAGALQIVLGVAVAATAAAAGWRYFGRWTAVLAGALAALSPVLIQAERILTPDFLFAAVSLGGAILLAEGVRRDPTSGRLLAAAGVIFGLAAYIKPVAIVLVLAGILPLAVATRNARATLRGSAIVAVAAALVFMPWVIRNWAVYDYPNMSSIGGVTLFLLAFDEAQLPVPNDTDDGRLVARLRSRALEGANPPSNTEYVVLDGLMAGGRSFQDAADIERDMAMTALRRAPRTYLRTGWENVRVLFEGVTNSTSARPNLEEAAPEQPNRVVHSTSKSLWYGGMVLGDIWSRLSAGGLFCFLLLLARDVRRRAAAAAFLSVWLLVSVGTAFTTWPHPADLRFPAQAAPTMLVLGSAAIVFVLDAVISRVRGRAP